MFTNGGTTPWKLEIAKRQATLATHGDYFHVSEVIECLSSDDSEAGEEDLPPTQRSKGLQRRLAEERSTRKMRAEEKAIHTEEAESRNRGRYEALRGSKARDEACKSEVESE